MDLGSARASVSIVLIISSLAGTGFGWLSKRFGRTSYVHYTTMRDQSADAIYMPGSEMCLGSKFITHHSSLTNQLTCISIRHSR